MKKRIVFVKARNKAFIIILWGTGLRISEALSLNTDQIKNDYLTILGKGSKRKINTNNPPSKKGFNRMDFRKV